MSLYRLPSEEVILERWSIRESDAGTFHFVGFDHVASNGRVSTAIRVFDAFNRTALTASGSEYLLVGRAGHDSDAEYVWQHTTRAWKFGKWTDVTSEFVPDWRQGCSLGEIINNPSGPGVDEARNAPRPASIGHLAAQAQHTASGVKFCGYRATAYEGRYVDSAISLPLISEISGGGFLLSDDSKCTDPDRRFLRTVRILMQLRALRERPIGGAVQLKPLMTVQIDRLGNQVDDTGEPAARFEMLVDSKGVRVILHIPGQSHVDLGPVETESGDGVWETVLQFLPSGECTGPDSDGSVSWT